jgi:hypothetical protein
MIGWRNIDVTAHERFAVTAVAAGELTVLVEGCHEYVPGRVR